MLPHPTASCPFGAMVWWSESEDALNCLLRAGIRIQHHCGKMGNCRSCAVVSIGGDVLLAPKLFGIRLSCQLFCWPFDKRKRPFVLVIDLLRC
jgi:hypothetical protein